MLANGVATERHEGTPQGGPLSPLLANVLLDEVDKELEKRGHSFVRYADDCDVYVRSRRAGERVMGLLQRLYTRLKLRINEAKSAIAIATSRKLLGYSFWDAPGRTVKCRIAKKALETMKERVRLITRRTVGRSIGRVAAELRSYLVGWKTASHSPSSNWKRGTTIFRELRSRGPLRVRRCKDRHQRPAMVEKLGHAHQRRISHQLLRPTGYPSAGLVTSTLRTARCGPACRVVWQGTRGIALGPYADCDRGRRSYSSPSAFTSAMSCGRPAARLFLISALRPITGISQPSRVKLSPSAIASANVMPSAR